MDFVNRAAAALRRARAQADARNLEAADSMSNEEALCFVEKQDPLAPMTPSRFSIIYFGTYDGLEGKAVCFAPTLEAACAARRVLEMADHLRDISVSHHKVPWAREQKQEYWGKRYSIFDREEAAFVGPNQDRARQNW